MDINTTGTFQDENEESLVDRTYGEGLAGSFDLGLPASDVHSPAADPSGDDSGGEVDEEDGTSTRYPGRNDVEKESTLEDWASTIMHDFLHLRFQMFEITSPTCHSSQAIDNVSSVMTNLLRVQTRMETIREKLSELKTAESQKKPSMHCLRFIFTVKLLPHLLFFFPRWNQGV